ncbi:MAG: Sec-independent protein translocase protein TatB [Rickettsiales bacterium]
MFDIGFSELLLIGIVALVVIGPKDLPVVIKHIAGFLRELRGLYAGMRHQMHQVMDEAGITDMKNEMTTIIDLEGKPQKAFDVRELETFKATHKVVGPESEHKPKDHGAFNSDD